MTRSQKTILTFLSVIACALLALVGFLGYQAYITLWQAPLGPAIAMPTSTWSLPATWTAAPPDFTPSPGPTITLAPTGTPVEATYCSGPPVMTLLAVGTDARSNSYTYGLADVIRIVRVDFVKAKVTILEFPRDLWVEIPYISDNLNGLDHGKLNQAYLYGQPGDGFAYWDDPSQGPGLLSLTLDLNFGVQADHYLAVNMRTFENVVNAIDGITINVPDLETAYNTGLPIGKHHLDGAEALKVARNRKQGMYERVKNQNLVLCAMREKVLSPTVITQVPALIESFRDNIQTDFTPEQLSQLACLGTKLPTENIAFASFPQELLKEDVRIFEDPEFPKGLLVTEADFDILREYVTRFNAGTWPNLPAASTTTETEEESSASFCP